MGITATYNKREFNKGLNKDLDKLIDDAINLFFNLGKRAVDIAFSDGNYINRTGVLRSSIGCGVSYNGVTKKVYGFMPVNGSNEGVREGREFLDSVLKQNVRRNEVKLVVVAGAEHASYVEDNSKYIVIENAKDFVEANVGSILKQLKVITI